MGSENREKKGFHPIYLLAAGYVAAVYLVVLLAFFISREDSVEIGGGLGLFLIPIVLGAVNLLVVVIGRDRISREQLLNCTILIKYALIPMYIAGGIMVAVSLLLMLMPIAFMIFVGPAIAIAFSAFGWIVMVGGAPYSVAYIVKSRKQGVHGTVLSVFAGIFQFFFTVDVLSIIVLALKEKRWVKTTVALLILLLLTVLALVVCLVGLLTLG